MKITNTKYPNLNLANEDERGENLIIDFIISSSVGFSLAWLTYQNLLSAIFIYYVSRFLYYFLFESVTGRTPGKYQTRTIVVDKDGNKPSKNQLVIRSLSRFFSIFSGISDNERAIHDSLSDTFVISDKNLKKLEFRRPLIFLFNQSILIFLTYSFLDEPEYEFWDILAITLLTFAILSGFVIAFIKLSKTKKASKY